MGFNLGMTCSGLIYITLITIVFFKKKRIVSLENKIYSYLLIASVIELIMGLLGFVTIAYFNDFFLRRIINILYLISLVSWTMIFTLYVISISFCTKIEKISSSKIIAIFMSEELDKVFNKNKEELNRDNLKNNLYTIKKILTIMGGAIITNSTYGKGTTMKVILDQKIVPDEFSPELKLYNNKKILLIDSNENTYKIFKKILHSDNINIDYVGVGKLGLDKIREKEKYDLVFIEDDLKPLDGYEIIKKLNNIKTFNSPVVLLTKDSNIEYNDDYKKYGFKNYLLKPIKKKDLFEIIDRLTNDK